MKKRRDFLRLFVFLGYGIKARDHPLRTLRQKHGMQGKFFYQMPVQQCAAKFE